MQQLQIAQGIISTKQVEADSKVQLAIVEGRIKKDIAELQARTALLVQAQKDGAAGWEALLNKDYQAIEHVANLDDQQQEREHALQLQREQQAHEQAQAQQAQQAAAEQAQQQPPAPTSS